MLKLYLYKPQPLVLPQHHEDGKDTDLNDPLWTGKSRNEMSQQGQCSTSHSDSKTTEQLSPSSRKEHLHYVFNVWESLPNEERNLPLASFPLERDLPRAEGPTKNHWTSWLVPVPVSREGDVSQELTCPWILQAWGRVERRISVGASDEGQTKSLSRKSPVQEQRTQMWFINVSVTGLQGLATEAKRGRTLSLWGIGFLIFIKIC